jgi:hypothetical protein
MIEHRIRCDSATLAKSNKCERKIQVLEEEFRLPVTLSAMGTIREHSQGN